MHDPLAVGAAIEPDLVETTRLYVQVETQGKITSGMTAADLRPVIRHGNNSNACICTGVDADKFLTLFLEAIKGQ